jgi:hypothetical protein
MRGVVLGNSHNVKIRMLLVCILQEAKRKDG